MFENFNEQQELKIPKTKFTGYEKLNDEGKILALFNQKAEPVESLQGQGYLILDQTPLFALGGGQDSDQGELFLNQQKIDLLDLRKDVLPNYYLHAINTHNSIIKTGDQLQIKVNEKNRQMNSIHHSAIHLTWQTILNFVGYHIPEIGNKVTTQKFTMQFENEAKLTPELMETVVEYVNQELFPRNITTKIFWVSQEEAKANDWLLFFTKLKKDEKVRIVEFPDYVLEPCSGTHIKNTSEIPKEYFLDFDRNPKRLLIACTCNADFARQWFAEKNGAKYQEIITTIEKLKTNNYPENIENWQKEAEELNQIWSYLATKKLNNLLREITKIANVFFQEKERKIQEEYQNLVIQPIIINQFAIYQTTNENYTNRLMLRKASQMATQNLEQTLIFINSSQLGTNAILVHNKKINFDLKNWLSGCLQESEFKGGGSPSMMQIASPKINDAKKLLEYISQK